MLHTYEMTLGERVIREMSRIPNATYATVLTTTEGDNVSLWRNRREALDQRYTILDASIRIGHGATVAVVEAKRVESED